MRIHPTLVLGVASLLLCCALPVEARQDGSRGSRNMELIDRKSVV